MHPLKTALFHLISAKCHFVSCQSGALSNTTTAKLGLGVSSKASQTNVSIVGTFAFGPFTATNSWHTSSWQKGEHGGTSSYSKKACCSLGLRVALFAISENRNSCRVCHPG
eukprot:jgi/Psemu1/309723/fgenesh1_kg.549_\